MKATADTLAGWRLDGQTLSFGCQRCPLLARCGGYSRDAAGWSCMDQCATCDRTTCDKVCLKKPARFAEDLLEVGGFGYHGIPHLLQRASSDRLPLYIPTIQHGSERLDDLSVPWAAIPMHRLVRFRNGRYAPIVGSPSELRRHFRLNADTRLVLVGINEDRPIERYWRWRRFHDTPQALSSLGFDCVLVPNYSFALDDPRPQHLFNRKRSLICAAEFSRAGIPPVPCLQAVAPSDWSYWQDFLTAHAEISTVAKEFQTGLTNRLRGLLAIEALARIQDRVNRRLHVIAVGGGKYGADLARRFDTWTIIDSVPFMKAAHRQIAGVMDRRVNWSLLPDGDVGELLAHNILRWSDWVAARSRRKSSRSKTRPPRLPA